MSKYKYEVLPKCPFHNKLAKDATTFKSVKPKLKFVNKPKIGLEEYGFNPDFDLMNNNVSLYSKIVTDPYELINLWYIRDIYVYKKLPFWKEMMIEMDDLNIEIKEINNVININNFMMIPVVSKYITNTYDSTYLFYDIFNKFNLISGSVKPQRFFLFYLIGPYEIKDATLYLYNDFFEVVSSLRRHRSKDVEGDLYWACYRPISWGQDLIWNKINHRAKDILGLDIENIIHDLRSSKDLDRLLEMVGKNNKMDFIFIRDTSPLPSIYCLSELIGIFVMYIDVITSLFLLEKGGHLLIQVHNNNFTEPLNSLFYFLSGIFEETHSYKSVLAKDYYYHKSFVFKNFKGVDKSLLNKLKKSVDQWNKNEGSVGMSINVKKQNLTICKYEKFDKTKHQERFVEQIFEFDKPITDKFKNFIKKGNKELEKLIKDKIMIAEEYNQAMITLSKARGIELTHRILQKNVAQALEWCKQNNIRINPYYENDKKSSDLISHYKHMKYFFPKCKNKDIDFYKLLMTREGVYSISRPEAAEMISQYIKRYIDDNPRKMTITDATANVGGNTIRFAMEFGHVNSVEISTETYDVLVNNVNVYGFDNVETYNADILSIMNYLEQDIIFFDPPWGGITYKEKASISLYLSGIPIGKVVNFISDSVKMVAIKIPRNFDFKSFFKNNKKYKNVKIHNIFNFKLMILRRN